MGHRGDHERDDHGGHGHGHRSGHRHDPSHHHHAHHSPAAHEHKSHAPATVSAYIITSSDTRTIETDETGRLIRSALEGAGHSVAGHVVVKDDTSQLIAALDQALLAGARAVLFNGGTGIGRRDVVVEALRPMFEKELPGFGELFRYLSFQEIGSPAMLSRAVAGTYRGAILFALPGSPQAVTLAMEALILPELGHLVRELSR
ncbi:MAG: molybdenum cofactor biosynthesis protein MoaB [Myxococcaceae bacterium]|nr:molybdenum cofactor biosynthesis protein MoaB [Myxococcaceae bacterium]